MSLAASTARAHDTWFERLPAEARIQILSEAAAAAAAAPAPEAPLLVLGTGNRFPVRESAIEPRYLAEQGCRVSRLVVGMAPLRTEPRGLVLRALPAAATCWAQLSPFRVTLEADKIELYLREMNAGPALRATWAAMAARGVSWNERYTKHARIEMQAPSSLPSPMAVDLVIEAAEGGLRAGDTITARVTRQGRPLPRQPVELRSENSALGIWRETDADGRLRVRAPAPGRWLLRAIALRLSAEPDTWESDFVTLAFEIGPAASR